MSNIVFHPVAQPILGVLALGTIAWLLSRAWPQLGKFLALAAGVWVVVAGCSLWGLGTVSFDQPLLALPLTATTSLSVQFSLTSLGNLLSIGTGILAVLITLYAFRSLAGTRGEGRFYACLIGVLAGACMVGWAGNFLVLLVGWELVAVMLWLLANQGSTEPRQGARRIFAVLGLADACLMLAVALMLSLGVAGVSPAAGTASTPLYNLALPAVSTPLLPYGLGWRGYAIYALLLAAALAKAGAVPLHSSHAAAPVPASLPAAVDKLLGIYLLARVTLDVFRPDPVVQSVLLAVGAVTLLTGVFMAMMQHNLRRLLSLHAVSQVGYVVLGIATGTALGVVGAVLHMLNNAVYKSGLFLMSGSVIRATGSEKIEDMGGLARKLPVTFVCGSVAAAAISGVPPFNGFVSKWLIYNGALSMNSAAGLLMLVVAVFGSALTLASFIKVLYSAFLSRTPTAARPEPRESFWMAAPMVALAAACLVLGLWPQGVINALIVPGVQHSMPQVAAELATGTVLAVNVGGQTRGLWSLSSAMLLVLLGLVGGGLVLLLITKRKVRVVRPFISGEVVTNDDRFRLPGTGFYETIRRLPVLGALLRLGEPEGQGPDHSSGPDGHAPAKPTGLLSLCLAWCAVGLGGFLIYLLLLVRA